MFVLGVDANAGGLAEISLRAAKKPARGGLANVAFARLSLEDAPADLAGIADAVTVLFPWGSLLRAIALPDPALLSRLTALVKPGGTLRAIYGYGAADGLELPEIDLARPGIRELSLDEVRELPTTWAKKLVYGGKPRRFVELRVGA